MPEVALYIDGFNFFYGVHNTFTKRRQKRGGPNLGGLTYCDFRLLVEQFFLEEGDELSLIKYFTAPVTRDEPGADRRAGEPGRYRHGREAVESIEGLTVIQGYHKQHSRVRIPKVRKITETQLANSLLPLDRLPGYWQLPQEYLQSKRRTATKRCAA